MSIVTKLNQFAKITAATVAVSCETQMELCEEVGGTKGVILAAAYGFNTTFGTIGLFQKRNRKAAILSNLINVGLCYALTTNEQREKYTLIACEKIDNRVREIVK